MPPVPANYMVGRGQTRPATQAEYDAILRQRAANARNIRNIKFGTAATAALITGGAAGAFGGAGTASGVAAPAASGAGTLAPIAGGAPWAVTPLAGTASMAAPSYAALAGTAAAAAPVTGTSFMSGVTAPTYAAPDLIGGSAAAGGGGAAGGGAGGGGDVAAAGGTSKTIMGLATAAGFLRDFLGNRNTRATDEQRRQAELALVKIQQEFNRAMLQMKIDADAKAAAADLQDRREQRDLDRQKIDPYARTRSQADTMEQLDRLSNRTAFDYDISGLPFGGMMPHNRGTIGYEPSPDVKAWATTRGGQVRSGDPSLDIGAPSYKPPVSTTMPVPPVVDDPLRDPTGLQMSVDPMTSTGLQMSVDQLMAAPASARRPIPRRRRTPMAQPMR